MSSSSRTNVLGVDPGRLKTGVAIVNRDGDILWRAIVAPDSLEARLPELLRQWQIARVALGDSTASKEARAQIERALTDAEADAKIELCIVDESGSTLEARPLYWADNPRTGWRKLVPLSLQEPPEPIDDYAAAVVARRSL